MSAQRAARTHVVEIPTLSASRIGASSSRMALGIWYMSPMCLCIHIWYICACVVLCMCIMALAHGD